MRRIDQRMKQRGVLVNKLDAVEWRDMTGRHWHQFEENQKRNETKLSVVWRNHKMKENLKSAIFALFTVFHFILSDSEVHSFEACVGACK